MAATFIPVKLEDFEAAFGLPSKKDPTKRAFDLIKPDGQEAYYECCLRQNNVGKLVVRVYTSVRSDRQKARECGEDAIRIAIVWLDNDGWSSGVGNKPARVYRSGGAGATAKDIINRAFDRTKKVSIEAMKFPICNCGRIMVNRKSKHGEFYGCIGFGNSNCSFTLKK